MTGIDHFRGLKEMVADHSLTLTHALRTLAPNASAVCAMAGAV